MNSSVMSGYGSAMGRANIDAVSIKELPMALVHTREVRRESRAARCDLAACHWVLASARLFVVQAGRGPLRKARHGIGFSANRPPLAPCRTVH